MSNMPPMQPKSSRLLFFERWIRNPFSVASITPSSAKLAQKMVDAIPLSEGVVVELGAGTGAITKLLLDSGIAPEMIVIVERDPHFYDYLSLQYPFCKVVLGDALSLKAVLENSGVTSPVRAVVSGLPFLTLSACMQNSLLSQSFAITKDNGPFIQFSYSVKSPLKPEVREQLRVKENCTANVFWNFPPAKVWSFEGFANSQQKISKYKGE